MGAGVGISLHGDVQDPYEISFSKPGPQDATESEAYPSRRATKVLSGHVSLGAPAAATAILTVYLDGYPVGTIHVPAGQNHADAVFTSTYLGEAPCRLNVGWTSNPPASGCTVIIDLV